jgi:hypothetical protein
VKGEPKVKSRRQLVVKVVGLPKELAKGLKNCKQYRKRVASRRMELDKKGTCKSGNISY